MESKRRIKMIKKPSNSSKICYIFPNTLSEENVLIENTRKNLQTIKRYYCTNRPKLFRINTDKARNESLENYEVDIENLKKNLKKIELDYYSNNAKLERIKKRKATDILRVKFPSILPKRKRTMHNTIKTLNSTK